MIRSPTPFASSAFFAPWRLSSLRLGPLCAFVIARAQRARSNLPRARDQPATNAAKRRWVRNAANGPPGGSIQRARAVIEAVRRA